MKASFLVTKNEYKILENGNEHRVITGGVVDFCNSRFGTNLTEEMSQEEILGVLNGIS